MNNKEVLILWDCSHIWGILALRGFRTLGFNCRLVKSKDISHGDALGKASGLLVVPGGSARLKANALGRPGLRAINKWVRAGGCYLGFCGGCGLALTSENSSSLNLCPWTRGSYSKRIYHLISGNVGAIFQDGKKATLPVWWPGRFAPTRDTEVEIIARYASPTEDLWLADAPYRDVAGYDFADDKFLARSGFPAGDPLIIKGKSGDGDYVLSYSHLETPDSPDANLSLLELLGMTGKRVIPEWRPLSEDYPDKNTRTAAGELIARTLASVRELIKTGEEGGIFYKRRPWLAGWRDGVP
ncbi:MAG: hypothetical protein K2H64_02475, partial [Desulfovibrio sp.]|nr:hypothetical protein [Desulfovibrio sp.]